MRSWWRKAGLAALITVSLAVAAVLSHLGLDQMSLAALLVAIGAAGGALVFLLKRVGDILAGTRKLTRQLQESARSSSRVRAEIVDRLRASEAEIRTLGRQLEVATSAIKEGTAQTERNLQHTRRDLENRLDAIDQSVQQANSASGLLKSQSFRQVQSDTLREVEALLRLRSEYPVQFDTPLLGGFALSPRGMWHLLTVVREHRPDTIVELGSGLSTLYLTRCTAGMPGTVIYSLEHDESYLAATRDVLQQHEAEDAVTLVHAPLVTTDVAGEPYPWYRLPSSLPESIDLLVVDGPPGRTGSLARMPAMACLFDRLTVGAIVILDDADRDDERAIARSWEQEYGLCRRPSGTPRQVVFQRVSSS